MLCKPSVRKKGYVSGIAAGTFLDKKTGAHDLGFGLHIMDFLLAPGWRDDGYERDPKLHGNLPKHYVEGPQICTQAKVLKPEIIRGKDFVAVRIALHVQHSRAKATKPARSGSKRSSFSPACATSSPANGSPASTTSTTCSIGSTCRATFATRAATRSRKFISAICRSRFPRQSSTTISLPTRNSSTSASRPAKRQPCRSG